jgi:hypothetical protein
MPTTREFTVHLEDSPGTLGKLCRALADRGVNVVAFQSFPESKGKSTVRLVTDNPTMTKSVLESEHTTHTETQIAQTKLPHRPGGLASAAAKLGEAKININYAYPGIEPGTNVPVVIFGVAEVGQATKILDEVAAAAA